MLTTLRASKVMPITTCANSHNNHSPYVDYYSHFINIQYINYAIINISRCKSLVKPLLLKRVIKLISNYSVGSRLLELRRIAELSQEQLAFDAEMTTSYYGQVERGERNITVLKLEKICRVLNVSLADFFSGFEIKNPAGSDEISGQILYQLSGRTPDEKQAVLRMVKLAFSLQKMKK